MKPNRMKQQGFTLLELMIYTALVSLVLAGVFAAYRDQLQAQVIQREVSEMQQNMRAGIALMERELRMAGLNPMDTTGIGINTAAAGQIQFSMDYTGGADDGVDNDNDGIIDQGKDGADNNANGLIDEPDEAEWYDGAANGSGENVIYRLSNDADGDGRNDGGTCHLVRVDNGNTMVVALNIDALNFVYLDKDGSVIPTPVAADNLRLIRSVQVTLVGRSGAAISTLEKNFKDAETYRNQREDVILPAQNDAFRRFMLSTEVKCRNLGLEM